MGWILQISVNVRHWSHVSECGFVPFFWARDSRAGNYRAEMPTFEMYFIFWREKEKISIPAKKKEMCNFSPLRERNGLLIAIWHFQPIAQWCRRKKRHACASFKLNRSPIQLKRSEKSIFFHEKTTTTSLSPLSTNLFFSTLILLVGSFPL